MTAALTIALASIGVVATVVVVVAVCVRELSDARQEVRSALERVVLAQSARIEALENRLLSHRWQDYAQLQNDVIGETQRFLEAWGAADPRGEAYGERPEEMREAAAVAEGIDLEGPIIG